MPTETEDRAEILRLHNQWFRANEGLRIDQMQDVMAGEAFHHFNLNGFSYGGVKEISKLWEALPAAFELVALKNDADLRVHVRGDMGWVSLESEVELIMVDQEGSGNMKGEGERVTMPFRITEIYVRDDGDGNPTWKMWHFHCSQRLTEGPRFVTE